jgi:hypothetical protein
VAESNRWRKGLYVTTGVEIGDGGRYTFEGGYPTTETVRRAYDEADLVRAVWAYRFFYPTVSLHATWLGNDAGGVIANRAFPLLEGTPRQLVFTPNSDTPYSALALDLSAGPMVLELPPGLLMGTANDLNQLWVMDIGLPGPAGAKGGKHLLLPPGYAGDVPDGYYTATPTTNRVLVLVRALPQHKDMDAAVELMKTVRAYPLQPDPNWTDPEWVDLTTQDGLDFTPVRWETSLDYWQALHETIDTDPPNEAYRHAYGELAELGIAKDQPFAPDDRMTAILTRAAEMGHAQMCVQSFADRRADRVVWQGRHWEWAVLRAENGTFETDGYVDLYAREKWFYQAQIESPAMFRRTPGAGSLYWLGLRDQHGQYLTGDQTYTLSVPKPVPAGLFWSITVYDAETRSEIATDQNLAALRSMFELDGAPTDTPMVLHFGSAQPQDTAGRWIKTIPGKGWFVYFRIYGPTDAAFDGTWRLPDFEAQHQHGGRG